MDQVECVENGDTFKLLLVLTRCKAVRASCLSALGRRHCCQAIDGARLPTDPLLHLVQSGVVLFNTSAKLHGLKEIQADI